MYILSVMVVFFFKQKTAYEMRISDWSSDVCSSDLRRYCHVSSFFPPGGVAACVDISHGSRRRRDGADFRGGGFALEDPLHERVCPGCGQAHQWRSAGDRKSVV